MAAMKSAQHAQGLHVLSVLQNARQLGAMIARSGGAERAPLEPLRPYVSDLVAALDKLANYERQAVARGELSVDTSADEIGVILENAAGLLNETEDDRVVRNRTAEEVKDIFSLDGDEDDNDEDAAAPATLASGSAFELDD